MSVPETSHLESWYWASFHELRIWTHRALSEVEEDTLDSALVRDLLGDAKCPGLSKMPVLIQVPENLDRDRKQMAAFGAVNYLVSQTDSEHGKVFQTALERLLRQRDEGVDSWISSPRLVLGISMGIRHFGTQGSMSSLGEEVNERLGRELQSNTTDMRDMLLSSRAILLLTPDSAAMGAQLNPVVRQVLARGEDSLSSREVVAVIWAFYRLGAYCSPPRHHELMETARRLYERLPELQVSAFEPLDWAMLWVALDKLHANLSPHRTADPVKQVESSIDNFTDMVNTLRYRRKSKPALEVEDEYDVQDILFVALKGAFPDLEREDWTGKDMGSNKRVDLVSSHQKVIVELKVVKDRRHAREVFDEIKVDIQSYHAHPACENLVVFIYDPQKLIQSARNKEEEFSGPREVRPGKLVNVQLRIRP